MHSVDWLMNANRANMPAGSTLFQWESERKWTAYGLPCFITISQTSKHSFCHHPLYVSSLHPNLRIRVFRLLTGTFTHFELQINKKKLTYVVTYMLCSCPWSRLLRALKGPIQRRSIMTVVASWDPFPLVTTHICLKCTVKLCGSFFTMAICLKKLTPLPPVACDDSGDMELFL